MAAMLSSERATRARREPLTVDRLGGSRLRVRNLVSESEHVVDLVARECDCSDYEFRMGPAGGRCKHLHLADQIVAGEICPDCCRPLCRPSCPGRGE